MNSVTFMDDRTFRVGDRVRFHTGSSWGTGKVIGFGKDGGAVTVKVKADPDAEIGRSDRWPLKTGGYFDRPRDHGIGGGNIQEKLRKKPSKNRYEVVGHQGSPSEVRDLREAAERYLLTYPKLGATTHLTFVVRHSGGEPLTAKEEADLGRLIDARMRKNPSKLPVKAGNFHAPAFHKSGWACYRLVQKRTDEAIDKQMVFWAPDDAAARAYVPKVTFDYATPVRLERALPTDREQADAAWTRSRARRNPSKLPTLSAAAVQAA
jgi:hypothetical protein